MKQWKRVLGVILSLVMLVSMCSMLASCGDDEETANGVGIDPEDAAIAGNGTYVVSVKTAGGMPMTGVAVYVYADNTLKDLKQFKETDEKGKVQLQLDQGGDYAVTLTGVPKGYEVAKSYFFTDNIANIVLKSSVITGEDMVGATLGLGDVMYDFTVTTPKGEKITLSEMLKEKEVVLVNFWYTTCSWCLKEFPYMQEAYKQFEDKVGIVALNPMNEADSAIQSFQESYQLTFPMASCPAAWSTTFNISGYPTSVLVDRYGVICLVEAGGITSQRPFISMFEHFTAEKYEQKLYNALSDMVTNVKPNIPNEKAEDIAAALNASGAPITYRHAEGEDAEYAWPFIITEKDGKKCVKASNSEIDGSYSILIADVTLKKGQALGLDYLVSSEAASDVLHIIVEDEPIYQISGVDEKPVWKSCYPWVAAADGTYEVVLSYIKDESDMAGEDTAYIRNLRVVDAAKVDADTYLPRQAATENKDGTYSYITPVYNAADGYYHVGTKNGPLLLADLMGYTQFNEEESLWDMLNNGDIKKGSTNYYDLILPYCNMASNSSLEGVSSVNKELGKYLQEAARIAGFDDDKNEWLKLCKYYEAYGTGGKQLQDPCKGLMPFNAYTAKLGKNVASNYFEYHQVVMPRGYLAEFAPTKSGVYRITSHATSQEGVEAWIFDKDRNELLVYEMDERAYEDSENVSMVYYMKAGEKYYIDIAFWDVYEEGVIPYDIEYVAASYDLFRLCSPGYFTYDGDATGETMYYLIHGGIDVVLKNGKYYEKLASGKTGSLIYADFTGMTSLFSNPIVTTPAYNADGSVKKNDKGETEYVKGMIDMGGFDFSKTDDDLYVLSILEKYNGDQAKATAYLKEQWGDSYEENYSLYKVEDVYAGKYHGKGKDLTAEIKTYVNKMEKSGPAKGCVVVDKRLAEILQLLMDKYTFENVDQSWLKMCYYYDHLGPNG